MVLQRELHEHDPSLLERPSLVVLSKADALGPDADARASEVAALIGQPVLPLSSVDGTGVERLLTALALQFPPETPAEPPKWNPLED
jgi:GTPase involved in cell partitioning and DNA repair